MNNPLNNIAAESVKRLAAEDRIKIKGHKPLCLWFTGLPGSGKTTIASAVERKLNQNNIHTYLLDGDIIRKGLNKDLGFDNESRTENIRRIGEVSKLFVDAGLIVIAAFISPFKKDRDIVRSLYDDNRFIEVFIDCSLQDCEERDVKGLYKKARAGEIKEFTGISSPYEKPAAPELYIRNGNNSVLNNNINTVYEFVMKLIV